MLFTFHNNLDWLWTLHQFTGIRSIMSKWWITFFVEILYVTNNSPCKSHALACKYGRESWARAHSWLWCQCHQEIHQLVCHLSLKNACNKHVKTFVSVSDRKIILMFVILKLLPCNFNNDSKFIRNLSKRFKLHIDLIKRRHDSHRSCYFKLHNLLCVNLFELVILAQQMS